MWHSFSFQTQYPPWPKLAQFPHACCVCPCINFPYPNYSVCFWFEPLLGNPGCIMCLLYLSVFVFFQSLLCMHLKAICKESCLEFAVRGFPTLVSFRVLPPFAEFFRLNFLPLPQAPSGSLHCPATWCLLLQCMHFCHSVFVHCCAILQKKLASFICFAASISHLLSEDVFKIAFICLWPGVWGSTKKKTYFVPFWDFSSL